MKRTSAIAWTLAVALGAGLLAMPRAARAFPWSIDMFRGQALQPLARAARNQPEGTLAINGHAPMSRQVASETLHNPLEPTKAVLAHGKVLYDDNCSVCHGITGHGDGTVRFLLKVPPPDLTAGMATARTDGYIYATIRNGSYIMPSYVDAMSPKERWEVVLYLRSLQGKVAAK